MIREIICYFVGLSIGILIGISWGKNKVLANVLGMMAQLIDHLTQLPSSEYTTGAGAYIAKLHVLIHEAYPTPVDISSVREIANDNP